MQGKSVLRTPSFWDRPRILVEVPEFKGEFSGLAPNSTTLRNESLCILVCGLLSVVCGQEVRRSGGQEVRKSAQKIENRRKFVWKLDLEFVWNFEFGICLGFGI